MNKMSSNFYWLLVDITVYMVEIIEYSNTKHKRDFLLHMRQRWTLPICIKQQNLIIDSTSCTWEKHSKISMPWKHRNLNCSFHQLVVDKKNMTGEKKGLMIIITRINHTNVKLFTINVNANNPRSTSCFCTLSNLKWNAQKTKSYSPTQVYEHEPTRETYCKSNCAKAKNSNNRASFNLCSIPHCSKTWMIVLC